MAQTVLSAAAIFFASAVVGHAVLRLSGRPAWNPLAPGIGLATLTAVAALAIKAPGKELMAFAAVSALSLAALLFVRRDVVSRPTLPVVGAALLALAFAVVPFVVNGRVGLLGVSFNNDLSSHLPWMEALRSETMRGLWGITEGYPLGPHSLVVALSSGFGLDLADVTTGLLLAVMPMVAIAALAALRDLPPALQVTTAGASSAAYLFSSYYAQGAFKETMFALFLLSAMLLARQLAERDAFRFREWLPFIVLFAGALYTYSYFGLAWLGLALIAWIVVESLGRGWLWPPRRTWQVVRPHLRRALPGLVVLGLLAAPEIVRLLDLYRAAGLSPADSGAVSTSNLGNLVQPLSPYEALGIWQSDDFRLAADNTLANRLWRLLSLAAAIFGLAWWTVKRDFTLPVAVVVSAGLYVYADGRESPYITAKALAIVSPLVLLVALRALFSHPAARWRWQAPIRAVAAALLVAGALSSTYLSLRNAQVGAANEPDAMTALQPIVKGQPTLFLAHDEYYRTWLHDTPLGHPYQTALMPTPQRPAKRFEYGDPFDFDTVTAQQLDTFRYVITTDAAFQSEPPPNFEIVEEVGGLRLWERRGPTPERRILQEKAAFGSVLDCSRPRGRRLARQPGTASVVAHPVTETAAGGFVEDRVGSLGLSLPAGRWRISLQYQATQWLEVSGAGMEARLPPRLSRPGPFWDVGEVDLPRAAAVTFELRLDDASPLYSRAQTTVPGTLAATRVAAPRRVPLRRACGRYVDWYTVSP